jgi:hypothetical protein
MPSLIGNKPNQIPTNGDLGSMAFADAENYYTDEETEELLAAKAPVIGANWTFVQVGTELVASYNGTRRFKVDPSGNAVVSGDVTAFGTV